MTSSGPTASSTARLKVFVGELLRCKNIVFLTGAGISAESGVPTFRGAGGLWRTYSAQSLATPEAFRSDPSLVWQFYSYRRELVSAISPNKGHYAITKLQDLMERDFGAEVSVITQNVDGLHSEAGNRRVFEMHGSLWRVKCTRCGNKTSNYDIPIVEALGPKSSYLKNPAEQYEDGTSAICSGSELADSVWIPDKDLPKCQNIVSQKACKGLLRPDIVWFGETLNSNIMRACDLLLSKCDMLIVVGTSVQVYPAAGFVPIVSARGTPVVEINLEETPATASCKYSFLGKSGEILDQVLDLLTEEIEGIN
eukprot:Nk52_evm32s78 gene=Nk52_evmTU32s78